TKDLPETALEWLEAHGDLKVDKLVPAAVAGLEQFFAEDAEINELWSENKKLYAKWKKPILEMKGRLERAIGAPAQAPAKPVAKAQPKPAVKPARKPPVNKAGKKAVKKQKTSPRKKPKSA
ncbi:MAG: DUF4259 domain-containing protein, partial [Planctomycetes bacterium]|nr:DUF4259 domain-containing protein [Planctomycetota bacterium]